jgi:hypothetical protein
VRTFSTRQRTELTHSYHCSIIVSHIFSTSKQKYEKERIEFRCFVRLMSYTECFVICTNDANHDCMHGWNPTSCHVCTYHPLAHVNLEPLLDRLPTHWALTRPNREMAMLDWDHNICTPLTHDHMTTRKQCDVRKLLIAYLTV